MFDAFASKGAVSWTWRFLVLLCLAGLLTPALAKEYSLPKSADRLEKIPWAKDLTKRTDQVWRPKYDATAPETPNPCRIVSYAGKWSRHDFGGHDGLSGSCGWRYSISPVLQDRKMGDKIVKMIFDQVDMDGDGDKTDDFIVYSPFNLDVPLNAEDWPLSHTFPERLSATFYGGITWYLANNSKKKPEFVAEWGINCDHAGAIYDGRAEDHPFNGLRHRTIPNSFLKHYIAMVWKKEDFLNKGSHYRVSFDDSSRMSTFFMRYWYGFNDIRMIVQNGDRFYISELAPNIPNDAFNSKRYNYNAFNPIMYPTKITWAEYTPDEYKIDLDVENATFEKMIFDDVQAVGLYAAKTDTSPANTHTKWYGFECDAVVHAPKEPSAHIEMVSIEGPGGEAAEPLSVPPFNMAITEVPFSLWQDIYLYGNAPCAIIQSRYGYKKPGSMGSMLYGKRTHEHEEPLTDVAFYDAFAICNTLSEMEGKTPCYYLDPDFQTIFKNQHLHEKADFNEQSAFLRRNFESPTYYPNPLPKIFVKWTANGHRLPTAAEWKEAAKGQGSGDRGQGSAGTQPVASSQPNANGIYDMIGNVWELCWTFGDVYDPEANPVITALGGDYNYPGSPEDHPVSVYGNVPYDGLANIGIRLVNRDAGLPPPPMGAAKESGIAMQDTPQWNFKQGEIFGKKQQAKTISESVMDMVSIPSGSFERVDKAIITIAAFEMSKYTTTYANWVDVYKWALANGYSFLMPGDMGSMRWFDFTHSPEEPVTHISWHDAITWCNALSEMEGKKPCYYYDEARTQVVREAFAYHPPKLAGAEYVPSQNEFIGHGLMEFYAHPYIFTSWDTDGYRLPTVAELEYVIRGGIDNHWETEIKSKEDYMWLPMTAAGRTHEVGMKKANFFGLHDIQGNVWEYAFDTYRDHSRPFDRDVDNPIRSPFSAWQKPKGAAAGVESTRLYVGGPSFLTGRHHIGGKSSMGGTQQYASHYYPDLGFRPVRCEVGTHPRDMRRELAPERIINYIHISADRIFEFGE